MKTLVATGSLAISALLGSALWGASRPSEPLDAQLDSRLLPVEALVVEASDGYQVGETYAGRVVSRRKSELGFERGGRLEEVRVDEGDRVAEGDLLAALDTRALRAQRRELAARIEETRARLALARVTTERRRALAERDHASQQELDEALYSEQALAAQLQAARAALENLDVRLDLSQIRAPYAGSVTARHVDEGTVVGAGEPILSVIEDGALEVRIGVPPEVAAELEPGSEHRIRVEGREIPARLHAILATVETDTRTTSAIFHLVEAPASDAASPVRDGALARVTLQRRVSSQGMWLPITALAESRRGLWSAYVLDAEEGGAYRADRRQLEVIHPEAERAFVRGTLREGELVVASGVHRLVPGMQVRLASDVAAAPAPPADAATTDSASR